MPGPLPAAGASPHPGLEGWLAALAGHGADVGAGPAAALVVGLAAGLVATAASASPEWDGAPAAVAQARTVARRASRLAREDADAYATARAALAPGAGDDVELGAALDRARRLLLAIAEAAGDAAGLAALVVEQGGAARRADAAGAALLACAAAESAVHLAAVNLAARAGDAGTARGADILVLARAGAARALQVST